MTTGIASGLGATFGFATESTWNTYVAPTKFATFNKEAITLKKNVVQSHALHGGLYDLATRRAYTTHTVAGSLDLDVYDRGLGQLFNLALGGAAPAPTQIGTTTAYATVFTPGDTTGKSVSIQVGRPFTSGTISPFSWSGCKITDWTINVQTGQQAALSFSVDAATESTAQTYTAPSYVASNMLHFAEATLIINGTPSTTALTITSVSTANPGVVTTSTPHGLSTGDVLTIASVGGATQANGTWPITVLSTTTFSIPINVTGTYTSGGTATPVGTVISGGTPIGVVKSCQIKGTNVLDVSRFFLGANGTKAEQLANGFRQLTGQLDVEFENLTDVYTAFAADSQVSLQLTFVGPTITGTAPDGIQSVFQVLVPAVYWDTGVPTVDGPAVLHAQVNFTGLDNGVNPPVQFTTVSLDSTL